MHAFIHSFIIQSVSQSVSESVSQSVNIWYFYFWWESLFIKAQHKYKQLPQTALVIYIKSQQTNL